MHDRGIVSVDMETLVRPAYMVPETKDLGALLTEFRRTNQHMAIVIDEYGSMEGIVTLEDLLEEIVGEIEDEFDLPDETVERIDDDTIRIDGTFPIDDFNEQFDCDLPDEDYHTVAGFVFGELGRTAEPGDEVTHNGLLFNVDSVEGQRIDRLRSRSSRGAGRSSRKTTTPRRSFFAPGRVNLIGEYTDLAGGLALPAAIDLGVTLTVEPADELSIVLGRAAISSASVAAVVAELGGAVEPCRGVSRRRCRSAQGCRRPRAVHVVLALALGGLEGSSSRALAAQRAEHRALGVPSGILDQAASRCSAATGMRCCSTSTRSRSSTFRCPTASRSWSSTRASRAGTPRPATPRGSASSRRGCRRAFVTSSPRTGRVRAVVAALRAGDLAALGALFREGHESLRDDFEVTTPELDRLVELAVRRTAPFAARMTGGGFGGAIVALVDADDAHALRRADARHARG